MISYLFLLAYMELQNILSLKPFKTNASYQSSFKQPSIYAVISYQLIYFTFLIFFRTVLREQAYYQEGMSLYYFLCIIL